MGAFIQVAQQKEKKKQLMPVKTAVQAHGYRNDWSGKETFHPVLIPL